MSVSFMLAYFGSQRLSTSIILTAYTTVRQIDVRSRNRLDGYLDKRGESRVNEAVLCRELIKPTNYIQAGMVSGWAEHSVLVSQYTLSQDPKL